MTGKLRALIVDDEPPARRRLLALLKGHQDVEVIAECGSAKEAAAAIARRRPDVVFLDVQMPDGDGFDVIGKVGIENMPAVIFVTAYDHYALRAFEVNALDYLLKPFDERRFAAALRRVRRRIAERQDSEPATLQRLLKAIAELKAGSPYRDRFAVKSAGRIYFVPVEEIDWIAASGKYVRIHAGGDEHLYRAPIGEIEGLLDPALFARIHRSTIVNLKRIKELQPLFHGEYAVILRDGAELILSRGCRRKLRGLFDLPE